MCHAILAQLKGYEWLDSLLDGINDVLGEEYGDLESVIEALISGNMEAVD